MEVKNIIKSAFQELDLRALEEIKKSNKHFMEKDENESVPPSKPQKEVSEEKNKDLEENLERGQNIGNSLEGLEKEEEEKIEGNLEKEVDLSLLKSGVVQKRGTQ